MRALGETCRNPFRSIVVRAVEILYAFDEAVRIIDDYEQPDSPAVEHWSRAPASATGGPRRPAACSTTRYELDDEGKIVTRQDRPADLPEPEVDRRGPARGRAAR